MVTSTFHQCIKYQKDGEAHTCQADLQPYSVEEANSFDAYLYFPAGAGSSSAPNERNKEAVFRPASEMPCENNYPCVQNDVKPLPFPYHEELLQQFTRETPYINSYPYLQSQLSMESAVFLYNESEATTSQFTLGAYPGGAQPYFDPYGDMIPTLMLSSEDPIARSMGGPHFDNGYPCYGLLQYDVGMIPLPGSVNQDPASSSAINMPHIVGGRHPDPIFRQGQWDPVKIERKPISKPARRKRNLKINVIGTFTEAVKGESQYSGIPRQTLSVRPVGNPSVTTSEIKNRSDVGDDESNRLDRIVPMTINMISLRNEFALTEIEEEEAASGTWPCQWTLDLLKKIPSQMNVYKLLQLEPEAREALAQALQNPEPYEDEVHWFCEFGVSFTNQDMLIQDNHDRPLYVRGRLKVGSRRCRIKRILVDAGSTGNVIPLKTIQKMGLDVTDLEPADTYVCGFGSMVETVLGYVTLRLGLGAWKTHLTAMVIGADTGYNLLLGRTWIHDHFVVPSTLHQCLKYQINGEEYTYPADLHPYSYNELHLPGAAQYFDLQTGIERGYLHHGAQEEPAHIEIGNSREGTLKYWRPIRKPTNAFAVYTLSVATGYEPEATPYHLALDMLKAIPSHTNVFKLLQLEPETRRVLSEALRNPELYEDDLVWSSEFGVSFTDKDMLVNWNHRRPLFLQGRLETCNRQCAVKRILVDGGSAGNLIPLDTIKNLGLGLDDLEPTDAYLTGFNSQIERIVGMITLQLELETWKTEVTAYVVEAETNWSMVLGRRWLHRNSVVPSTLHQCLKYEKDGEVYTCNADLHPFLPDELHLLDADLYLDPIDDTDGRYPYEPRHEEQVYIEASTSRNRKTRRYRKYWKNLKKMASFSSANMLSIETSTKRQRKATEQHKSASEADRAVTEEHEIAEIAMGIHRMTIKELDVAKVHKIMTEGQDATKDHEIVTRARKTTPEKEVITNQQKLTDEKPTSEQTCLKEQPGNPNSWTLVRNKRKRARTWTKNPFPAHASSTTRQKSSANSSKLRHSSQAAQQKSRTVREKSMPRQVLPPVHSYYSYSPSTNLLMHRLVKMWQQVEETEEEYTPSPHMLRNLGSFIPRHLFQDPEDETPEENFSVNVIYVNDTLPANLLVEDDLCFPDELLESEVTLKSGKVLAGPVPPKEATPPISDESPVIQNSLLRSYTLQIIQCWDT
ncbi:retropepsin-like aspartic protease [Serratia marcescens]|nr:retropepsin-like domain-containing protein [Serratia marcescens]